ncbi:hypothetical protein LT493_06325 [Streptomyces tricolor]|nr:hypothetical protein [Streptomyces tricolor]
MQKSHDVIPMWRLYTQLLLAKKLIDLHVSQQAVRVVQEMRATIDGGGLLAFNSLPDALLATLDLQAGRFAEAIDRGRRRHRPQRPAAVGRQREARPFGGRHGAPSEGRAGPGRAPIGGLPPAFRLLRVPGLRRAGRLHRDRARRGRGRTAPGRRADAHEMVSAGHHLRVSRGGPGPGGLDGGDGPRGGGPGPRGPRAARDRAARPEQSGRAGPRIRGRARPFGSARPAPRRRHGPRLRDRCRSRCRPARSGGRAPAVRSAAAEGAPPGGPARHADRRDEPAQRPLRPPVRPPGTRTGPRRTSTTGWPRSPSERSRSPGTWPGG